MTGSEGRQNRAQVSRRHSTSRTSRPGDRRSSRSSAERRQRRASLSRTDTLEAVDDTTGEQPVVDDTPADETEDRPEIVAPRRSTGRAGALALRTGSSLLTRVGHVNPRRALALLVVLVFVALTLAVPVRTYLSQRSEYNRVQAENAQLRNEVGDYEKKITQQNDPAYIEAMARQRLQYAMPGEKVVVLTHPDRDREEAAKRQADAYASNPWYENLWDAVSTPPED